MSLLLLFRAGGSAVSAAAPATPRATFESLEVYAEVTKPDGRRYRWDGDGDAEDIPTGVQCSSKRMEGYATASLTLARRIDQDHPDIEIRDEINLYSASGEKVWEGRVSAAPRSMDDNHTIDVQATGWMSTSRDRKFRQIFVDRQFSSWGEPALARKAAVAAAGFGQGKIPASTDGGLNWTPPAESMPISEVSELVYDCGDELQASKIMYRGTRTGLWTSFEAPGLYASGTSDFASAASYGLTLDNTTRTTSITAAQYLMLRAATSGAVTPPAGYLKKYDQMAVYGDHGLSTHAISGEPDGLYASEVMEWIIQTYCPKLTWAGNDSTYPIPHLLFKELTHPYDALLACNAFHLLDLACWEDRKVYWYPVDLTDWDWEVRLDDPGFKPTMEGDSIDDQYNGIDIEYPDLLTGVTKFLYADDHAELRDTDELNPANRHGDKAYAAEKLSNPATEGSALQIGRAILAEKNQPKSPGNYQISGGYIRDRQGNWQPAWKVKATDRIVIADHPNRRPRLITEASWSQDSHTLTVATDSAIQRIDAMQDRLQNALLANNLS